MDGPDETSRPDAVLLPFLRASDATLDEHVSTLLAEQTETTIRGIVRSNLHVSLSSSDGSHNNQEALDLLAEVQSQLLASLRALKSHTAPRTIGNLRKYAAAVTFNACHQWLRKKYPRRFQLKNKLRYLFTHSPDLALWETDEKEWLCGLASWRDARSASEASVPHSAGSGQGRDGFIDAVRSILHRLNRPALLDDVVTLVADALGIRDDVAQKERTRGQAADELRPVPHAQAGILTELEQRAELQRVWSAICELPLRHRAALLLGLRGQQGADALALLPLTRIASIREIATVLEFAPEQFARVWNELPWDDLTIAGHLGLSRQQVINLRQSARARVARQVKGG